eukprot:scaffold6710_cov175-Amphora_coffeaeformis.AAC.8
MSRPKIGFKCHSGRTLPVLLHMNEYDYRPFVTMPSFRCVFAVAVVVVVVVVADVGLDLPTWLRLQLRLRDCLVCVCVLLSKQAGCVDGMVYCNKVYGM